MGDAPLLFTLSTQQDYGWFLAALGWLACWLAWRRTGREDVALRWLPWSALAGLLTAGLEISLLITPVAAQPYLGSRLGWDVALGAVAALQLAGWCWSAQDRHPAWKRITSCSIIVVLAGMIVLLRISHPDAGSLVFAVLTTGVGVAFLPSTQHRPEIRAALGFAVLGLWVASYGPLAGSVGAPRAFSDLSVLGAPAAFLQLLAAGFTGAGLFRRLVGTRLHHRPEAVTEGRRLAGWFLVWLACGLALAWGMGRMAGRQFAQGAVGRVRAAAVLIDRRLLEQSLRPAFHLGEPKHYPLPSGRQGFCFMPEGLDARRLRPISEALTAIEQANPDIDWARVLVVRGGYVLGLCESTRMPDHFFAGSLPVHNAVTAADWTTWTARRAELAGPLVDAYGEFLQARAPLTAGDGRMLGWLALDFSPTPWVASQAQARLLVFVIVGLGGVLLLMYWLQRLGALEREAAQRAAAAAEAADQAKTHFLARVSHELRTPIQSILGYGELLARLPLEPESQRWLGAVRAQGLLLTRLVNDLIDLSALQAGAFRLAPRPGDLVALVRATTDSLLPRAAAKRLDLACEIDPAVTRWLSFDGERVRQVLLNLVNNAIKFTGQGRVRVRLRPGATDHLYLLEVIDTGPGIAPEDQARLFRPFSRLEPASAVEGAGLGLALSAAICESMGGQLRLVSDGVHGCTFTASLPLSAAAPPATTEEAGSTPNLGGRRVLIADDNALVRELFLTGLRAAGAWCESVGDGLEAVERCAVEKFDVVVIDISMPWLDGFETTRRLRALGTPGLRIVGVSAHAGAQERAQAEAAGMNAFLVKPVSLTALMAAVTGLPAGAMITGAVAADLALLRRLRAQFRQEAGRLQAELKLAAQSDDRRWLRARVHYLKNSADVAGYPELGLLCTQLEELLAAPMDQPPAMSIRDRVAEICRGLDRHAGLASEND